MCLHSYTAEASQLFGGTFFFFRLSEQPLWCRLMVMSWQAVKHTTLDFCRLLSGQKFRAAIWKLCSSRWQKHAAVYFCELPGTAVLQAAPVLSCFPIPHALCNPPACYDHEVNKTLGHHKSLANDMSGAEIRQRGAVEHGRTGLSSRSSSSSTWSQCVRSLLKLQLN